MSAVQDTEAIVTVRLPQQLAAELRGVAARDANGMSATIRRLLMRAMERERQAEQPSAK